MFSPAFLSGQTTCTVWPTACIACSKTKISYSSLNSPTSMRIFLPGMVRVSLFCALIRIVSDAVAVGRVPIQVEDPVQLVGTGRRQGLRVLPLAERRKPVDRLHAS